MPGYNAQPVLVAAVKDGMRCRHCKLLLRDPIRTEDGDRLCRSCFEDILKLPDCLCAECGITVVTRQCYRDRAIRWQMERLEVLCRYSTIGCQWKGQLSEWEEHIEKCTVRHSSTIVPFIETWEAKREDDVAPDHEQLRFPEPEEAAMQEDREIQPLVPFQVDNEVDRPRKLHNRVEDLQRQVQTSLHSSLLGKVYRRLEELTMEQVTIKHSVSELELLLQASLAMASTHNGSFLWRIPDFSRRRREGIEEKITSIYSPPFYTGRNGYKMCVRAYLNGDGMGYRTHLSLFFVIMRGEYDPLLKWPFDYKVSMILVDQTHRKHIVQTFKPTPESNAFSRPVSDMNVASGCPTFSKLAVFGDPDNDYVKGDVMFVKCIVDTTMIFHP